MLLATKKLQKIFETFSSYLALLEHTHLHLVAMQSLMSCCKVFFFFDFVVVFYPPPGTAQWIPWTAGVSNTPPFT